MTTNAAEILQELRMDHRNMAVLLDLLQEEIDRIGNAEDIDLELVDDIMRYMTVYSDAIHHPREDLVYAGLLAAHPKLAEGMERVGDDHREIATLGIRLRNDIEAVIAGTAVPRERLINDTRDYLHRMRQHMAWEEEDLFRRIDAEADTLEVDVSHLVASDPVFGEQRQDSFAGLYAAIQRESTTH